MSELLPRVAEVLDAYLRSLETGDAPNRETLLARHPDLADDLAAALDTLDFVHRASRGLAKGEDDAGPGKALGDYRLLREVGRGGMAVVYEAEQVSLGRRVALKVLPFAAVLDPKQLQRFKNEALAAAHLRHPNIVPVYGVGCERGVHYYAMQYVEGQSLAAAIRDLKGGGGGRSSEERLPGCTGEGPKTPISSHGSNREPAYIRMAAMLGVQAAEALDHAHELGIVHRDVKPGNLLVDEAGTLWVTDFGLARSVADVGLTMTGEILGTIRYMSPEQALAKRAPIDHRTDIYSLGATLYELFTLEPAFPGDDPHLVIQDIATREPIPPRKLNPALPVDLETVLLKAMAKEPSRRYATAQEMADDLDRYLEHKPVLARRPSVAVRAGKWSRRHRAVVVASAVILLLSVAALAIDAYRVGSALKLAERNLAQTRAAVDKFLLEAGTEDRNEQPLPSPARRELLEAALWFYETQEESPVSLRKRGRILHALHRYDEALVMFDRILAARPQDCRALIDRADMLWHLKRHAEALAELDRAIAIEPLPEAHDQRGLTLAALDRFDEALAAHDRAIALEPNVVRYHHNRGNVLYHSLGKWDLALAAYERALALRPSDAWAETGRADALHSLGRFDEALLAYERAIAIDPANTEAQNGRGNALCSLGRFREAVAAYDIALALNPGYAWAHTGRGSALCALGKWEEAVAAHRQALALEPKPKTAGAAHNNIGVAYYRAGNLTEAASEFRAAIGVLPDWAEPYCNLGSALWNLGAHDEAIHEYRKALKLRPDFAELRYNLADSLLETGQVSEAVTELELAIRDRPDFAMSYILLGRIRLDQGDYERALALFKQGHELGSRRSDWQQPSAELIKLAERRIDLSARVEQVLAGRDRPRDSAERIEFAEMLYARKLHAEAARMWETAFAEDAALAEDLERNLRYNAVCCAALANVAEWRGKALEWLRADLAAREMAASGLAEMLQHWKRDRDLASIRDRIDELPEPEREAWHSFWAAVDRALSGPPQAK